METVRYLYRARVGSQAEAALVEEGNRARWVWNQCVVRSRCLFEEGETCGPAMLQLELTDWRGRKEWLAAGSVVVQQQTIRDFGNARAKALADIANRVPQGQRRGLPVLKSRHDYRTSLSYTTRGFSFDDKVLVLAGGIRVNIVWSRPLPSGPKSVRVYQDAVGWWWVSFVVSRDIEVFPAGTRPAVGIDWGVATIATTTDAAFDLEHPEYGKRAEKELAACQRTMARRRRPKGAVPSKGYQQARHDTARLYQKIVWQRSDLARKWARGVVAAHDQIAVEDFHPQFMARSTLANKAADARIGATKRELASYATRAGRDHRLVPAPYTTMTCGECGARAKHPLPLRERTFHCHECGHTAPRDRNSARVVRAAAGFNGARVEGIRRQTHHGQDAA